MRSRKHPDEEGRISRSKTVANTGCGKRGYTSRKVAAQVAARQRKQSGELIEYYRCKRCHVFHIGHPRGWRALEAERARWAS